jgi:hypothetical protein
MKTINKCLFPVITLMAILFCVAGCNPVKDLPSALPPELSVEEHPLQSAPTMEPLSFVPKQGTQEEVLAKHQDKRELPVEINMTSFNGQLGFGVQLGNDVLVAQETFETTPMELGMLQEVTAHVFKNGEEIYAIPAGESSPVNNLRGLWAYADHWVMEVAFVDLDVPNPNETPLEAIGKIIRDGEVLNDLYGYEEAFGFQLMDGKPFYFFKRAGQINFSYDGNDFPLGYTQIPHYLCCSAGSLNPRMAPTMVAFFAQQGENWYYVEIGVFK